MTQKLLSKVDPAGMGIRCGLDQAFLFGRHGYLPTRDTSQNRADLDHRGHALGTRLRFYLLYEIGQVVQGRHLVCHGDQRLAVGSADTMRQG